MQQGVLLWLRKVLWERIVLVISTLVNRATTKQSGSSMVAILPALLVLVHVDGIVAVVSSPS